MKEKFLAGGFLLVLLASAANALEIPKELPVYKLVSADGIFEDRAMTLSETFLGDFRGNKAKEIDGRYITKANGKSLEIYQTSGGIWFADENQLWNITIENASLPDENKAKEIADAFLSSRSLLPQDRSIDLTGSMLSIDYLGIGGTKVASLDLRNKTTEYMRQLDVQVNYGPRVKGENIDLPVVGGGGDICVVLGDQGEIIAFSGPRPGLEAQLKGSYPVVPLEQANTSYDDMVGNPQSLSYTVDLAYYLPPNMANQSYLIPVYEYRGTSIIDNETIPLLITLIPATKFPQEVYSEIGNRSMALDPDKDSRLNARITTAAANQSAISALSFSNPNSIYEYGTYWNGVPDHGPGNTQGFVDEMAAIGWTKLYQWGGSDAWESDWNRNENILDQYNTGIDNADITFYHGHGNPNGWGLSPPDDSFLDKSEVQRRYGDIDMEWVIIASCGPLESNDIIPCSSNPISAFNWGYVFNGLHGIMGRASVAYANTEEGRSVAKYMKQGNTVIDSWFRAAREVQPSTNGWSCPYGPQVYAAALVPYRGTISAENDHLWGCGSVSADIPNPDKFWLIWTQC